MADKNEDWLAKWMVTWREQDFTWEGLKKHTVQGWVVADGLLREAENGRVYGQSINETPQPVDGEQATLQDYWRADPATGRLRTDADMGAELVVRDSGARTPPSASPPPTAPGGEGAPAPHPETYHLAHLPLAYADGTPTGKADWPDDALDALVGARLLAASETTSEGESWNRKIAGPDRDAQLQGGIWIKAAVHPAGDAESLSVHHSFALTFRYPHFSRKEFSGDARFERAAFGGGAWFEGAAFSGDARFGGAAFGGAAWFNGAAFSGAAVFERAAFSDEARFEAAAFSGVAWFGRAVFSGVAWFQRAAFSGDAWFGGAAFSGVGWFQNATFSGEAWFGGSTFADLSFFVEAHFKGAMRFTAATFEKPASFKRIVWPSTEAVALWHGAFDQALFRGTLSLTGSGLQRFAALDGATFERGVQLDEVDEALAKRTFRAERRAAIKGADEKTSRDVHLRQLERGCRVLKLVFERAADKTREQLMYRFELQARRAQRKLPPGEALFSDLYRLASDYGASMIRPFIALAVLVALFAAAFVGWGALRGFVGPEAIVPQVAAWQALELSWLNVFKPLSALSEIDTPAGTLADKFLQDAPPLVFLFRVVSTVQGLLALVLAFLFALAVRRRFQIS